MWGDGILAFSLISCYLLFSYQDLLQQNCLASINSWEYSLLNISNCLGLLKYLIQLSNVWIMKSDQVGRPGVVPLMNEFTIQWTGAGRSSILPRGSVALSYECNVCLYRTKHQEIRSNQTLLIRKLWLNGVDLLFEVTCNAASDPYTVMFLCRIVISMRCLISSYFHPVSYIFQGTSYS